jgi:hypothetical protein
MTPCLVHEHLSATTASTSELFNSSDNRMVYKCDKCGQIVLIHATGWREVAPPQ